MARTTQKASKTTSGSARRVRFSVKHTRMIAGSTARVISSAAAKGKVTKRTSRSMSIESTSSLSSLTTLSSSPIHRAVSLDSSQQMPPWPTNRYCYICHNGSKCLFCCDFCPRVVCQRCLGLEEVKPELYASDVKFKCPGCHELGERDVKCKLTPYHAFMRNHNGEFVRVLDEPTTLVGVCERASKAQVCAESILILHLVCVGMEVRGSLPKLLHTTLEEYHTAESLTYEEVTFDFGTERKLGHWTKEAELLCARLEERNFGRKIIFVTVHSVVTRGDLFAGKDKDGDVAVTVEDFMDYVFIQPLNKIVYGSTLFMLTCGHMVRFEESYTAMKKSIIRLRPEYTILFTAPEFIVAATKLFAVAYSIQVLIHGYSFLDIFHDLLNVSLELKMHTDVLIFHISGLHAPKAPFGLRIPTLDVSQPPSIVGYRYSWYHSHRRPWGKALPMGCSRCGAVRPWSQSKHHPNGTHPKARVTTCLGCNLEVYSEPLPMEYEILQESKIFGWIKYTIWPSEVLSVRP